MAKRVVKVPAPVIAIDGTSGSGKGTVALEVANRLSWQLLDSGALYRILAWVADDVGVDVDDEEELAKLIATVDIQFLGEQVLVDNIDVSLAIRQDRIGASASFVAVHPKVREGLLSLQKNMRRLPGLVADGRDMGTVVFPDAKAKFFLDASAEARAERRYKQLNAKGLDASLRALLDSIKQRDERDKRRAVSPLIPAKDAMYIDSTDLDIDQVLEIVFLKIADLGIG
jgi:cytidylate kinase